MGGPTAPGGDDGRVDRMGGRDRTSGLGGLDGVDQADLAAAHGELAERMGIEVVEASAERVVGRMPVAGNRQPYGLLHGGASVVLAETLGSVGAALHQPGRGAVGIEINATHHRSATDGVVTGVATPVHRGRTVATYEVVITDEAGRRLCTSRITCLYRDF